VRFLALVVLVCALGVGAAAARPHGSASAEATLVTVNLGATRQVISGFGTSTRVWSDPHLAKSANVSVPPAGQRQVLQAIQRLGLTRIRPVLDPGVQKQPGGPFDFSGKLGDDHAAFVKQARRYGIPTVFPGPVFLEPWMTADDPGAYVDWAMAMLEHFRKDGIDLALYAPLNEPAVSGDFPPEWMHQVVLQLGRRMRAAGFRTKLVIPDDENPVDAYERAQAVLSDPESRKYVAAVAFHIYRDVTPENIARLRRLATQYDLPLWMTEYVNNDYTNWNSSLDWGVTIDTLLTEDVNAVDYLFAFFGNWVGDSTLVRMDFDDGRYKGMALTSMYWITGQFSRYVRPGDVRVAATHGSDGLLVTAFRGPHRATVVALNVGGSAQTIRFRVKGGKVGRVVKPVRSSESEQWRPLRAIPVRQGSFTAILPASSITTFRLSR
jgi:glucuronoarabinoxylan endo-1,4-beta-xylanase